MKVLAIGAHPDDLEILCAGTLRLMVERGDKVTMAHVANGDAGSFGHGPEEIAAIRRREAAAAAALIGAAHIAGTISDGRVNAATESQREFVVDVIRQVKPDLVITHAPNDYMPDHNEVSKLVFDAAFTASLPNYRTAHPAHDLVPALYYMDTVAGVDFLPTEYVDISESLEAKVEAFRRHESQVTWLSQHDGVDMPEQIRSVARFRGIQVGVTYAEGFTACRTWLRTRASRLLP
jgi:LmbE family N-acetylglucosaminyl deacetylase